MTSFSLEGDGLLGPGAVRRETPCLLPLPQPGEIFSLTLSLNSRANDPLTVIEGPWKAYIGTPVVGPTTRWFTVVVLQGDQRKFEGLRGELARHGRVPSGQWARVLVDTFSLNAVREVGVADPSWISSHGFPFFPAARRGKVEASSVRDEVGFFKNSLWLVEVDAPASGG